MKHTSLFAAPLTCALLLLAGCSKDPGAIATNGSKAFQSADAATRALWETSLAAMKTNGYAVAMLGFKQLGAQSNLTPEQAKAVGDTATALSDQMYAAANKGDANAVEAIKQLRSSFHR